MDGNEITVTAAARKEPIPIRGTVDLSRLTGFALANALTTAPAPQAVTHTDVVIARQMVQEAERERIAKVFADPASRGRERACAAALASTKNYSADQIIATLPKLPLDASARAEVDAERAKASSAMWDRAIAANTGKAPAGAEAKAKADPWAAAIADMTRRSN